jgi:transcriptional regulator with XRE-family HTH domain
MDESRQQPAASSRDERDPFLAALGERVRTLRARKGMTRRALALASAVSERHLASLELGVGNASVLVLRQVAQALGCPLAEMLGDETAASPEWLLFRDLLLGRSDSELRRARLALAEMYGQAGKPAARRRRVALVGLRGAGKSTVGVLSQLTSVGTLFAFVLVSLGVMILRRRRPDIPRGFRVPGGSYLVPLCGAGTSLYLMLQETSSTLIRLFGWMAIGLAVYFLYSRKHSKLTAPSSPPQ